MEVEDGIVAGLLETQCSSSKAISNSCIYITILWLWLVVTMVMMVLVLIIKK